MFDASHVQALLFDLDGTLADSDDQAVDALARRLRWMRWTDPRRVARHLVMACEAPVNGAITVLDKLGLDRPLTAWGRRIRSLRGRRGQTAHLRLMPGVPEMLAGLASRYQMAVVTTRVRRDARAFLAEYDLSNHFDALVTRESTRRLKPHPAPIFLAAHLLAIPVERCLMVGDTNVDVIAARRAGALAVAVLCGFGERAELQRAGAHAILERTALLPTLLQSPCRGD